jgi:hypothetical protein
MVWSIYNQHVSAFSESTIVATIPNPDPKSYDLLSSKISVPISTMAASNQSVELFVRAVNLLNEEIWQPEFVVGANSTPQADAGGRAVYVGVKVNW